ncbi:MAG: polysaccharide biosynthesis/export family protein [Candidatus Omnitrophica bacterium]|nr:polysaccharide biosynthesis/export family protein [Candidatus Omnitrophota bacterium]
MNKRLFIVLFLLSGVGMFFSTQELFSQKQGKDYVFNPGDVIEIDVYGEPDLHTVCSIPEDGNINFPLIGRLKAAGLTVKELERLITELLAQDYLVNPQVRIFVREYARIFIFGLVRQPGRYDLTKSLTLLSAISQAGGLLPEADPTRIKLIRAEGEKRYTQEIDLEKIMNNTAPDIILEPNDTIIIEAYGRVSIIGQVHRPGAYDFKKGLTLLELVSIAGGFRDIANIDGTSIIRNEDGKRRSIRIKVSDITKRGDKSKDIPLKPGDTVVVPESLF